MKGFYVILPQSAVAEIACKPDSIDNEAGEGWFKGVFSWRSELVAVASIEELCSLRSDQQQSGLRIVILHALEDVLEADFYALQLQAIPRPVTLDSNSLTVSTQVVEDNEYISSSVLVNGYNAVIPNLKMIERRIQEQIDKRGKQPKS
jgi:chemotaxis signal transduction protein